MRDFITISATSKPKVFGVDPSFLPASKDGRYTVPTILFLLKSRLLELGALHTVDVPACD